MPEVDVLERLRRANPVGTGPEGVNQVFGDDVTGTLFEAIRDGTFDGESRIGAQPGAGATS